ncbi:hypothetical protein V6Z11_A05G246000 [Gossypium hirsutum]
MLNVCQSIHQGWKMDHAVRKHPTKQKLYAEFFSSDSSGKEKASSSASSRFRSAIPRSITHIANQNLSTPHNQKQNCNRKRKNSKEKEREKKTLKIVPKRQSETCQSGRLSFSVLSLFPC